MGISDRREFDLSLFDLIIDAMIGYGLIGDPRGEIGEWIRRVNHSAQPVLALDVPSRLNSTTGVPGRPCIHATATMTLALPKTGLVVYEAKPYVGELYLADISMPPELYTRLGIEMPAIFAHDSIVKIEGG